MSKRKTFNVNDFKMWINERLTSDLLTPEHKRGLCNALDHVLHQTNNYNGYGYSYIDDTRPCLDGKTGNDSVNPAWTDYHDTRRHYF